MLPSNGRPRRTSRILLGYARSFPSQPPVIPPPNIIRGPSYPAGGREARLGRGRGAKIWWHGGHTLEWPEPGLGCVRSHEARHRLARSRPWILVHPQPRRPPSLLAHGSQTWARSRLIRAQTLCHGEEMIPWCKSEKGSMAMMIIRDTNYRQCVSELSSCDDTGKNRIDICA